MRRRASCWGRRWVAGLVAGLLVLAGCAHGRPLTPEERVERCTPNRAALLVVPFYTYYFMGRCAAASDLPAPTPEGPHEGAHQ